MPLLTTELCFQKSTDSSDPVTQALRDEIFPTLYATYQQSRAHPASLKIKNRTLRSLTRSCLYHKTEQQLRRTLADAESLFQKYCALNYNPSS